MPITEATEKIDYQALGAATANAVTQSLIQAGVVGQKISQQENKSVDEFEATMEAIASNPNSDPGTVAAIKNLFETYDKKVRHELTEAQKTEVAKAMVNERNRSTTNIIESAIDQYIETGSLADRFRDEIKNKVITTFTKDSKYADARTRYNQGDVDIKLLKEIAMAEVKAFATEKPQARAASGIASKDSSGETQSMIETNDEAPEDNTVSFANKAAEKAYLDSLTSKERDGYFARLGTMQRAGIDRHSKEAKASAQRFVNNIRKGAEAYRNGARPGGLQAVGRR
jgi:hypothetical protein